MEKLKTKIVIPCRLSYAHVWHPAVNNDGSMGKYSTALLIPKDDEKTIEKIKQAVKNATLEGKSKLANKSGKIPNNLKTPLRDADEEGLEDDAYKGHYFFNAASKSKPGIVDRHKNRIEDEDAVYSGCYCNVSVNFYAFAVEGNKGIAAGLNNIQKVKDGDRLSGGSTADEDFDDLGDDEGDDLDSIFDE